MCHSKSHAQCRSRCLLTLVSYLKTQCNQRAAEYWEWQANFHAEVIQKSDHARCQTTADAGKEPSQDQREDRRTKKEWKRCTAEQMRYQRYQFKERVSALVIRNVTWVLCFGCGVKRGFEERRYLSVCWWAVGVWRGIRTSAQALKRSATGQEPFLIPPAGPVREDLDLCSLSAPTHNSS